MAVRDVPRPEAEIARRFRELVGPDVPIAGTFDLHGNEDGEFLEHANFAFVTKRFPHYDSYIQGERAARALRITARGEYEPTTCKPEARGHHRYRAAVDRPVPGDGHHGAGGAGGRRASTTPT